MAYLKQARFITAENLVFSGENREAISAFSKGGEIPKSGFRRFPRKNFST